MPGASLDGFDEFEFADDGIAHPVFRAGTGPAVIVIHEGGGLHPGVIDFARRIIDRGMSVYLPSLFGTPGKPIGMAAAVRTIAGACVSREFTAFARNRTGPIVNWLRALSRRAHQECGGPGVGAVGMCFTGGFALGMSVDSEMLAPVLSQPSQPLGMGAKSRGALGISDDDLARVKARVRDDGVCLLGLRFSKDRFSPPERFETLKRELGDGFIAVEIDSGPDNPHGIKRSAHSVLTLDLVDEPGHPTRAALEQVLTFLAERLRVG